MSTILAAFWPHGRTRSRILLGAVAAIAGVLSSGVLAGVVIGVVLSLGWLVYELTGSAINLALTMAAQFVPHLLFGLFIGAWVDRLDRKRLMIVVDLLRAGAISTIPLLAAFDALTVWWIYGTGFVMSTLTIFFDSSQFAAVPSLVPKRELVSANGRIQATFSAAQVAGPLLGVERELLGLEVDRDEVGPLAERRVRARLGAVPQLAD